MSLLAHIDTNVNLLLPVWGHGVADAVSGKGHLHGLYSDASAEWF
jgi:hypothetical protein